jgi:DNA repair protein RadA/Sms
MSKLKTIYFCQNCGNESPKWIGKCPGCNEWNSYVEEKFSKSQPSSQNGAAQFSEIKPKPQSLSDIDTDGQPRLVLNDKELNRVLGGGLTPGSVTLIGGEPGIGKSTLILQLVLQQSDWKSLYVSGEESSGQIKMRADRLGMNNPNCFLLTETNTQEIFRELKAEQPHIVVIDSIQTLHSPLIESSAGSVSQIRECTSEFIRFAKETTTPVLLIGHITKEGSIAGPKVLEHMVDTVLQFEGDRNHVYRLLRSVKNRFGSTNELGIYEMQGVGLREVSNPSEVLLGDRNDQLSGSAVAACMEGLRPMLLEMQALVSSAVYGTPQRSATGFDTRRLNMLLAVLEKRCGFKLGLKDVFLNVAGGVRVEDPAADLAIVSAILSSNQDMPIRPGFVFAGEVGLSGEIRPVTRVDQRISEAQKLGFTHIVVSQYTKGIDPKDFDIHILRASRLEEALTHIFG